MNVKLNGESVSLSENVTLADFLEKNSIYPNTPGIAVAVNENIIFRISWKDILIYENDRIEIVHAAQGG